MGDEVINDSGEKKSLRSGQAASLALLASASLTAVASIAAAVSAWASWHALDQTRETQLLNRRVEACFELDRRAATRIVEALEQQRRRIYGEWGYDYFGTSYGEACEGSPAEVAACEASLARAAARAKKIRQEISRVRFESASTFHLIGPDSLARAEATLTTRLNALSEGEAAIQPALNAHRQFRTACAAAIGPYRLARRAL